MSQKSWKNGNAVAICVGVALPLLIVIALEGLSFLLNKSRYAAFYTRPGNAPNAWASAQRGNGPHGTISFFETLKPLRTYDDLDESNDFPELDRSQATVIDFFRKDGFFMNPDTRGRSVMKVARSQEVVFDVVNSTDHYGRRLTPHPDPKERSKHLILFGCSFGFGLGVNDDETLGAYLAQKAPDSRIYNNSIPGSSPSWVLRLLKEETLWKGVQENQGSAVYIFLNSHLARFFGSMSHVATWGEKSPYVDETENGVFEYKGSFISGRPFLTALYKWLWKSNIVQFFGIDLPLRFTNSHFQRFAQSLLQIKKAYLSRFPHSKFYVAGYPGFHSNSMIYLKPHLEKLGIDYIDYSPYDLGLYMKQPYQIAKDGHPTPFANRLWAEVLVRDLGVEKHDEKEKLERR